MSNEETSKQSDKRKPARDKTKMRLVESQKAIQRLHSEVLGILEEDEIEEARHLDFLTALDA